MRTVYYVRFAGDFMVLPTYSKVRAQKELEAKINKMSGARTQFDIISEPETEFKAARPNMMIRD